MTVSKICQRCQEPFTGRRQAKYCGDLCRWQDNAAKAYEMKKKDPKIKEFDEILTPDAPEGPKKKVGGRYAKQKGERGEREVCALITKITGEESKRKLGQAREGGGDVDWGPFLLEVKARSTVAMPAWQTQVCAAVEGTGQVPAVVWRRNGEKWWIAVPFEDFVSIFNTLRLAAMGAQGG